MPKDRWNSWLDPARAEIEEIRSLMEYSGQDQGLTVRAVSTAVNSGANDGNQLIEPIILGEPETLF